MYPVEQPSAKCDLVSPRFPSESLKDAWSFASPAALFQALKQPVPTHLKLLSTLYLYPSDAPDPPVSRSLAMVGVMDASSSMICKLIGARSVLGDGSDCLTRCTVSVRRADTPHHKKDLDQRHADNSLAFSRFVRKLCSEKVVAILAPDKFGRFGILTPSPELQGDGPLTSHDFYAHVYLGNVDAVSNNIAEDVGDTTSANQLSNTAVVDPELWVPPAAETSDGFSDAVNLWQPPGTIDSTTSYDPSEKFGDISSSKTGNKRKLSDFHGDAGAAAADAFYSNLTRSLETRADSRIYHLRAFNGWVKATQIQELNPKTKNNRDGPLRVLDLACGKGGDLGKWTLHQRGIENYVGSDVARGSLKDAAIRARKMRHKLARCTFTCADLGADVPGRLKGPKHKHMQKLLTWSLQNEPTIAAAEPKFQMLRGGGISHDDYFDVISVQFAIHYMMSSQQRARRFFKTVGELLDIGGNLIVTTIDARMVVWHLMNLGLDLHFRDPIEEDTPEAIISVGDGACILRFRPKIVKRIFTAGSKQDHALDELFGLEYSFTLVEGDNHSQGVGDAVNLPEWLTPIPVLKALANEAGLELESAENFHEFYQARSNPLQYAAAHSSMYNIKVLNRNGTISADEWEISRMYVALKFRKVRDTVMQTEESDEEDNDFEKGGRDDEEDQPISQEVKAKFMSIALMQAKNKVGQEEWTSLSSDEKNRLMNIELKKLASET